MIKNRKPKIEKWVFSPHAVLRMEERGISITEIETILTHPDFITEQGPKWVFAKKFEYRSDNNIAAVIIEKTKEKNLWVVITVMVKFQKKM